MNKLTRYTLSLLALFAATGLTAGCAKDEVKSTRKVETVHESEPQFVSPGEMVVE